MKSIDFSAKDGKAKSISPLNKAIQPIKLTITVALESQILWNRILSNPITIAIKATSIENFSSSRNDKICFILLGL